MDCSRTSATCTGPTSTLPVTTRRPDVFGGGRPFASELRFSIQQHLFLLGLIYRESTTTGLAHTGSKSRNLQEHETLRLGWGGNLQFSPRKRTNSKTTPKKLERNNKNSEKLSKNNSEDTPDSASNSSGGSEFKADDFLSFFFFFFFFFLT